MLIWSFDENDLIESGRYNSMTWPRGLVKCVWVSVMLLKQAWVFELEELTLHGICVYQVYTNRVY